MPPKEGLKLVTFSFAFKPELPELPFGALNWSNSSWSSSHSPSRQPSVWLAATHADKTLRMAARPSHISVSSLIWKHLKWILSQNANHIFANSSLSCSFLAKKVPAFRNEPMHRHRIIGTAFVSFQQNPYNVCVCVYVSSVAKRVCEIALLLQPKPKTPQTSICPSTSASIVGWICACVSWVKYLDLYIPLLSA